jgi:hypothetical protein
MVVSQFDEASSWLAKVVAVAWEYFESLTYSWLDGFMDSPKIGIHSNSLQMPPSLVAVCMARL